MALGAYNEALLKGNSTSLDTIKAWLAGSVGVDSLPAKPRILDVDRIEIDNADTTSGTPLQITSTATTTTIIGTSAAALTTGFLLTSLDADALTTGGIINISSTSSNTSSRNLVRVKNNSGAATGVNVVHLENDSTGDMLRMTSENGGAVGPVVRVRHLSATAADDDVTGRLVFAANDEEGTPTETTIGQIDCLWTDATAASYASRFIIYTSTGGAQNEAMRILDTGKIQVDLASEVNTGTGGGDVFDVYDDAKLLELWSVDSLSFADKMCEIGVMERKDSGSGYMLSIQDALFLLMGAAYQNRQRVDQNYERLDDKISELEAEIVELKKAA